MSVADPTILHRAAFETRHLAAYWETSFSCADLSGLAQTQFPMFKDNAGAATVVPQIEIPACRRARLVTWAWLIRYQAQPLGPAAVTLSIFKNNGGVAAATAILPSILGGFAMNKSAGTFFASSQTVDFDGHTGTPDSYHITVTTPNGIEFPIARLILGFEYA